MRLASLLMILVTLASAGCDECEYSAECSGVDASITRSDAGTGTPTPASVAVERAVTLVERPIANGLASLKLEILPPQDVEAPPGLPLGDFLASGSADIWIHANIRYSAALVGGRNVGDMVPYLRVGLEITNEDDGRRLSTNLVPVVSVANGVFYARNLSLGSSVGAATSHYSVRVVIRRPALLGADADAVSPGIVIGEDMVGAEAGTFLDDVATVITSHFSLDDLREQQVSTGTGGTPSTGGTSSSSGGGYIAP
ncbi:MAG: iron transporter [Myxococcota bacterium]